MQGYAVVIINGKATVDYASDVDLSTAIYETSYLVDAKNYAAKYNIKKGREGKMTEKLKELRLELGYTQAEFAEKLSYHQSKISEIESGKRTVPPYIWNAAVMLFKLETGDDYHG